MAIKIVSHSFSGIMIFILLQKRKFFTSISGRKNALTQLKKELIKIEASSELAANDAGGMIKTMFQEFMANKMSGKTGSITEKDVKNWIINKGYTTSEFPLIFEVFTILNEIQFAGSLIQERDHLLQIEKLIQKVLRAAEDIDRRILK